jgi:hypothetical protein
VGVDVEAEEHQASQQRRYEIGQPQLVGPRGAESRGPRSRLRVAAGSTIVVRQGLPRRLVPLEDGVRIAL